jgi:hypothetical protein
MRSLMLAVASLLSFSAFADNKQVVIDFYKTAFVKHQQARRITKLFPPL